MPLLSPRHALLLLTTMLMVLPSYAQEGLRIASPGSSDSFGYAVALDGTTLLVGAPGDDRLGTDAGAAYVFELVDGVWTLDATLTASDGTPQDFFGEAVTLRNGRALIGAPVADAESAEAGAVYVYERIGSVWTEMTRLTASDGGFRDRFGQAVGLGDDWAAIGAPLDNEVGTDAGSVYVYRWTGSAWVEVDELHAATTTSQDQLGSALAMQGEEFMVGAPYHDADGTDAGIAYTFAWNGLNWEETGMLRSDDIVDGDEFGFAVALDGDRALIGAPLENASGRNTGAAYSFARGDAGWTQIAKFAALDATAEDRFGAAVAVSGERALGGAPDRGTGTPSGTAYFLLTDGGFIGPDLAAGNVDPNLGQSVALSGQVGAIGATDAEQLGSGDGAVYIYDLAPIYTMSAERDELPGAARIESLFPNPMRDTGTLRLHMNRSGSVRVEVLDVLGRSVRTTDHGLLGVGTHELPLDATGLAGGVYVVQVEAGGFRQAHLVTVPARR